MDAREGTQLNEKWRLDTLLGQGGMATVYAATHRTGAKKAVKILDKRFSHSQEIKKRFLREARIANQINHPARVAIDDDDVSDQGEVFLVMERLFGCDLDSHLEGKRGMLSPEEALPIFETLLSLLSECHDKDIVHRDIKPANIFLTNEHGPKLLDFGIAHVHEGILGEELTREGELLGTPFTMAPEQALGLPTGKTVDVFAMGACMFMALSGKKIRDADNVAKLLAIASTMPVVSLAKHKSELPTALLALIDRALMFQPELRFQDARQMYEALLELLPKKQEKTRHAHERGIEVSGELFDEEPEILAKTTTDTSFWRAITVALTEGHSHGFSHKNTLHASREVLKHLRQLSSGRDKIFYTVTPNGIDCGNEPVWQPTRAPFDRVCYALFADGMRTLRFSADLSEEELLRFLEYLFRIAVGRMPAEDDTVTWFYEHGFVHIACEAIEGLVRNDDEQLKVDERIRKYVGFLDMGAAASVAAAAANVNLSSVLKHLRGIHLAEFTSQGIAAKLASQDTGDSEENRWDSLSIALVHAHGEAERTKSKYARSMFEQSLESFATSQILGGTTNELLLTCKALMVAMAKRDVDKVAPGTMDSVRRSLLGTEILRSVLLDLNSAISPDLLRKALSDIATSDLLFDVLHAIEKSEDEEVRQILEAHAVERAKTHEDALVKLALQKGERVALVVARALAKSNKKGQRALLGLLAHPVRCVRFEALSLMTDEEKVRKELSGILDRADATERLDVLALVAARKMSRAGPVLALRVRDDSFFDLTAKERRAWLTTLVLLNPRRAEAALLEILERSSVVAKSKLSSTQQLAIEILGDLPKSEEACGVLTRLSSAWIGVDDQVKAMANLTLERWKRP